MTQHPSNPELADAFRTNERYYRMMRKHNLEKGDRPNIESEIIDFILATPSGATLFDAGSGEGTITLWAARQLPEVSIIGVDLSPVGVEMSNKEAKAQKTPNLSFRVGNLEKLDLPEASVDRLWCQSVVEHVPDLEAMLREMYRIMKPGAEGIIRVSNAGSLPRFSLRHYLFDRLRPIPQKPSLKLKEGNYREHRHNFDAHELPSYTLLGMLSQAGFKIVRFTTFPDYLRTEPGPALRQALLRFFMLFRTIPFLRLLGPTMIVTFRR